MSKDCGNCAHEAGHGRCHVGSSGGGWSTGPCPHWRGEEPKTTSVEPKSPDGGNTCAPQSIRDRQPLNPTAPTSDEVKMDFQSTTLDVIQEVTTADVSPRIQILRQVRLILRAIHHRLGCTDPEPRITDDGFKVDLVGAHYTLTLWWESRRVSQMVSGLGDQGETSAIALLNSGDPEYNAARLVQAIFKGRQDAMLLFSSEPL